MSWRKYMMWFRICLIAALVVISQLPAALAGPSFVIIEVSGSAVPLAPGQMIGADKDVSLPKDGEIVLLGSDGKIVRVKGPFSGKITSAARASANAADGAKAGRLEKIANMISEHRALTETLGTSRSSPLKGAAESGDPWMVRLGRSGARCVRPDAAMFWRTNVSSDARLSIIGAQVAVKNKPWPAGQHQMPVPKEMLRDQELYTVLINNRQVDMTIFVLPDSARNPAQIAAWMAGKVCDKQAILYLKSLSTEARSAQ